MQDLVVFDENNSTCGYIHSCDFEPAFYEKLATSEVVYRYEKPFEVTKIALEKWFNRYHKNDSALSQAYLTDEAFLDYFKYHQSVWFTLKKVVMSETDLESNFFVMEVATNFKRAIIIFAKKPIPFDIRLTLKVKNEKNRYINNHYRISSSFLNLRAGIFHPINTPQNKRKNHLKDLPLFEKNHTYTFIENPNVRELFCGVLNLIEVDYDLACVDVFNKGFKSILRDTQSEKMDFVSRLGKINTASLDKTFGKRHRKPLVRPIMMAVSKHILPYYNLLGQRHLLIDYQGGSLLFKMYDSYCLSKQLTDFQMQTIYRFRAVFRLLTTSQQQKLIWLLKNYCSKNLKDKEFFRCVKAILLAQQTQTNECRYWYYDFWCSPSEIPKFFNKNNKKVKKFLNDEIWLLTSDKSELKNVPPLLIRFFEQCNLKSFVSYSGGEYALRQLLISDEPTHKESLPFAKRGLNPLLGVLVLQNNLSLLPFRNFAKDYKEVYGNLKFSHKDFKELLTQYQDFIDFFEKIGGVSFEKIKDRKNTKNLKNLHHDCQYWHQNFNAIDERVREFRKITPEQQALIDAIAVPDIFNLLGVPALKETKVKVNQLLTEKQFIDESIKMHHCVSLYFAQSIQGNCYIFHLECDQEMSTLEIALKTTLKTQPNLKTPQKAIFVQRQHKGKYNCEPSSQHKTKAKELIKQLNSFLSKNPKIDVIDIMEKATQSQKSALTAYQQTKFLNGRALTQKELHQLQLLFPKFKLLRLLQTNDDEKTAYAI